MPMMRPLFLAAGIFREGLEFVPCRYMIRPLSIRDIHYFENSVYHYFEKMIGALFIY